jgi:hypothetical protein
VYTNPATGKPTSAVPAESETLDELFDRIERWLDLWVVIGPRASGTAAPNSGSTGARDVRALTVLYLDWLKLRGRDQDYIGNRRCLINKWVLPVIGHVLVADWGVEESTAVIEAARPHLSAARVNDLGSVLSGLRSTAHRKRAGGRWLGP